MASLVEAINKKFEELNNGAIIGVLSSRASTASFKPSKVLFMDGQGIRRIGDQNELKELAGHVEELDLSANNIESWEEVFILLQSLPNLRSLNLSSNPLGQNFTPSKLVEIPVINHQPTKGLPLFDQSFSRRSDRKASFTSNSDSAHGSSLTSAESTPIATSIESMNEQCMDVASSVEDCQFEERLWTYDSVGDLTFDDQKQQNEQIYQKESLSPCKFAMKQGLIHETTSYPQLQSLILNSTNIPWPWVSEILERCPNLNELHLALNSYGTESGHLDQHKDQYSTSQRFTSLTSLFYSHNGPISWSSIVAINSVFPNLEHLVLLGNQLNSIPDDYADMKAFPILDKLKQLCLNDTLLNEWHSIDNLTAWLPNLHALKLGLSLPLFEGLSKEQCRGQVIARMPSLKMYNSRVISSSEREQAERDFLRQYSSLEPNLRPLKFDELERKHGVLEPLVEINLAPKKTVRIRVEFDGQEAWHELNLTHSVGQAKVEFASLFGLCESTRLELRESKAYQMKHLKLFYYDQVMCQIQGPEELRYVTRKIHSYKPDDGDMFQLIMMEPSK